MEWAGNSGNGTLSTQSYSSLTSRIRGAFSLGGVRFQAPDVATYTVIAGGLPVGSAVPVSSMVEITFDPINVPDGVLLTFSSDVPTRRRYLTSPSGYAVGNRAIVDNYTDGTTGSPVLELLLGPFEPVAWEVVLCGPVSGAPVAMPGVVVNGGAQGRPTPLPLFGRERAPGPR